MLALTFSATTAFGLARTQIEWASNKNKDHFHLTVTAMDNRKVLLNKRGLLTLSIHACTIIVQKTNNKVEEFQVPWGEGIVG
jgi:hypothetical protein